jgi:two-component system, cell cycle response regulator DivK
MVGDSKIVSLNTVSPLIFIVDDDIRVLRLVSQMLSKSNYRVHCVSSAGAALGWLESYTPDIILMDINLPGKDGFGILEDVKYLSKLSKTKIVAFTSFAMPGDEERFIKAGFDHYFAKPFNKDSLCSFLNKITDKAILECKTK